MGEVGFGGNILEDGNSVKFKTGSWKNKYPVHYKEKCKTVCFVLDTAQMTVSFTKMAF